MSGINNLDDLLVPNEKIPFLEKWFDVGFDDNQKKGAYTYNKIQSKKNLILSKSVSIWPFAG